MYQNPYQKYANAQNVILTNDSIIIENEQQFWKQTSSNFFLMIEKEKRIEEKPNTAHSIFLSQ